MVDDIRKASISILSKKLNEKTSTGYEKEIYKLSEKTWNRDVKDPEFLDHLRNIEYEKVGMLMNTKSKDERNLILLDMKNKRVGFDSHMFNANKKDFEYNIDREFRPMEVAEGIFECRKCGGKKTTSIGVQLRSADEPMTNFVTCVSCKNKWKC